MFSKFVDLFTFAAIRRYFIAGIVVVGPFFLTFYLIHFLVSAFATFSHIFVGFFIKQDSFVLNVPGLSMVLTLLFVIVVGIVARNIFGQLIVKATEVILSKTPLVRAIYSTTKQLFSLVSTNQDNAFGKPVLIEYPKKDLWVVGFITNTKEHKQINSSINKDSLRSVFIPTTPNPTSGFMLFVEESNIVRLNLSVEEAMRLVISAGSISLDEIKQEAIESKENK